MSKVTITLEDVDDQVMLNVDTGDDLPDSVDDLTNAQAAGLAATAYIVNEILASPVETEDSAA